ncbi:Piezo-type mechanosensitive ion channel component 2 [Durusdinium trenchii]|uniref:Piezo-type mechanosensitive ion channel component 2 n=1 Tax=Durusdinium trenchii TaxID=1381693 RepID=A0ABP0HTI8_9DINO
MAFPSHFTVVDLAPAALTTLPAWAREMMELMPSRDEVMGFLHCRSAEVLVLSIFLLVYPCPKDFLTSVQLILCLVLLAVPKRLAKYTSKFFTASAGVALMGQVLGFTVLRFNKELMRYFGMAPNVALVCRQLLILIFAKLEEMVEAPAPVPAPMEQEMVVLGGSQRSGSEMPAAWRIALRSDPVTEVRRLLLAVPQMAAVCIVAINAVEETAWCLPPLAVVGAFYASGAMVKPPLETGKRIPDQARFWIQVMAFSLAVGMLGEICTALWWPPWEGVPGKPQPAAIGLWDMCRNYDPWSPGLARSVDGRAQFPGMHAKAGWVPQRQRCGQDVVYWLCLESGIRVPKFALFFVLCWILRTDWERRPDRGRAAEPRSRWFRRTMASVSTRFFESLAPRRTEWSTTVAERESELKLFIITLAGIFCWIFVIVACGLQRQFNLVALGYLWMALATSSSVTNATLYHDPVRAVLWPARAVGIFNFLVIMAFSVCQCPSFPCPYAAKLEGLGGPDHISRFLSGEQCLYASRHAVSGEASDAWALGPLFQSVGMIKTGGALSGTLEEPCTQLFCGLEEFTIVTKELVHCLVFVSCLVQRILVERWNEDLREHFKRRKALLDFRAEWYAEKLATSRQVQLSMWDTKRQVLLNKLGRVTKQLNTLRSIWDGQRPAFTEEEEEENLQKARVEHICLQGGVNELLVSGLLKEFTKNYADQLLNLPSQQRLQAQAIIDKGVVDYLHRRYLRKLKMITSADEAASKKHLIQECQNEVEGIWKDVKGEENDAVELEEAPVEPSCLQLWCWAIVLRLAIGPSSPAAAVDEPKPLMGMWWVELCGTFVDESWLHGCGHLVWAADMLFIRDRWLGLLQRDGRRLLRSLEKDETLYEHRKGNSPRLLLCKALLSQSVLALVVAGALQFMSLRSLTSAISISVVVMALMAFPHVPWTARAGQDWGSEPQIGTL